MRSVLVKATTGADGKLHFAVPAEPGEYEVELRIRRVPPDNASGNGSAPATAAQPRPVEPYD